MICYNCDQRHDPRFCRGPLQRGRIHMCPRCGGKSHLFEHCAFGDPNVDDRDFFLYYPRQGLPPIATQVGCEDIIAQPGRHMLPVLSRDTAMEMNAQQVKTCERLGFTYKFPKIDYSTHREPHIEAQSLPQDLDLIGYNRGPPPSLNFRPKDLVAAPIPTGGQIYSGLSLPTGGQRSSGPSRL